MDASVAVLVDAKREYTNQLIQAIRTHLLSGVLSIYDEAFSVCEENKEPDLTMLTFQELLGEVPKWNSVMISDETNRIVEESQCDYLEDLLTAVFVCHTKILTTVRVTNKDRKINLKIPSVENFLHQVYIEMAREFWKHPYLLNPMEVTKLEYQQNLRKAETIIHDCMESTIRKLLPVKDILKEYLNEDDDDDNEEGNREDDEEKHTRERDLKRTGIDNKQITKGGGLDADDTCDSPSGMTGVNSKNRTTTTTTDSYKDVLRKELTELKACAKTDGVTFETDKEHVESNESNRPSLTSISSNSNSTPITCTSPPSPTKSKFDKMVDQLENSSGGTTHSSGSGTLDSHSSSVKTVNITGGGGGGKSSTSTQDSTTSTIPTTPSVESDGLGLGPSLLDSQTSKGLSVNGSNSGGDDGIQTNGGTLSTEPSTNGLPVLDLSEMNVPTSPTTTTPLVSSTPSTPKDTTELDLNDLFSGSGGGMPVVNVDFGGSSSSTSSSQPQANPSIMSNFDSLSTKPSSSEDKKEPFTFF